MGWCFKEGLKKAVGQKETQFQKMSAQPLEPALWQRLQGVATEMASDKFWRDMSKPYAHLAATVK